MDINKVGVGVVTCNRPIFFEKSMKSFIRHLDLPDNEESNRVVVVNDGDQPIKQFPGVHVIEHDNNRGVCISKNDALKWLLQNTELEHFFLIEDDIVSVNGHSPFEEYIKVAQETGLQHLMFGYHGPANKTGSHGIPTPRLIVEYPNRVRVALNEHCVGAFCYYSRRCLDEVGLLDENFYQAFDHVEHSYRIVKAGMCPAYWWWPDVSHSSTFLGEIACSEESSAIRFKDPKEWQENIQKAAMYFKEKHGCLPAWQGCVPDTDERLIYTKLREIKEQYGND